MNHVRPLAVVAACAALACCTQPAPEPTPPPPSPEPAPALAPPPPVSQPQYENWMDAPATPGDWYFRSTGSGSQAVFGPGESEAAFALTCNRSARTVTLTRAGSGGGNATMRIRTEFGDRTLAANAQGQTIATTLPATDPALASMAFTKGRFAVETLGLATLYIPSWPEMTRVIEDCR